MEVGGIVNTPVAASASADRLPLLTSVSATLLSTTARPATVSLLSTLKVDPSCPEMTTSSTNLMRSVVMLTVTVTVLSAQVVGATRAQTR